MSKTNSQELINAVSKENYEKVQTILSAGVQAYAIDYVSYKLICAVRDGSLEEARGLINSFGLSFSQAWSEGYVLLVEALKNERAAVAKLLVTSGCKIKSKNRKPCNTPLHFAVVSGDIEITKLLLREGAEINAKNKNGATPLLVAIHGHSGELTELLLKHGADVNDSKDGKRLLHFAAGQLQMVEHLLNYGADINCECTSLFTSYYYYRPLHFAVQLGSHEVVILLLSRGANVDVEGIDCITPLHIAAKFGYIDIAKTLINHGACTNSYTVNKRYTPLHFACEKRNEEIVKLLLNKGADIHDTTHANLSPLHIATETGCTKVVKLLLQHGAEVDNRDKNGKTTLHFAVESGSLPIVEEILKYCPDINDLSNRSSLEIAVHGKNKMYRKIVETLLEYGFIVNPKDAYNTYKLLHVAVEKGFLKIVEDLLKDGADVNRTFEGFTPLHLAAKEKQEEVAQLLISYEADINAQDKIGKTPIFYAIENAHLKITKLLLTHRAAIKYSPDLLNIAVKKNSIEIVETLLQHGADVNTSDKNGRTALHFTAFNKDINVEIAELLLSKGANVDAKQEDGTTALHIASKNGHKEVVKVLLEHGADVNSKSENDKTALHFACQERHVEVVYTLLEYGSDINITSKINRTHFDYGMPRCGSYFGQFCNIYDPDDSDFYPGLGFSSNKLIADAIEHHIVKLKTANLYVSERNLLSISNSNFKAKYKEEIASMKNEKINDSNVSFYDILAKHTNFLAICMGNENIVHVLKSDDYKTKFPMYASMIKSNFRKAMIRKELLEQGNTIFHFLSNNFPKLPYYCTEKICNYLSDQDLRNLIEACETHSIGNPDNNTDIDDYL